MDIPPILSLPSNVFRQLYVLVHGSENVEVEVDKDGQELQLLQSAVYFSPSSKA